MKDRNGTGLVEGDKVQVLRGGADYDFHTGEVVGPYTKYSGETRIILTFGPDFHLGNGDFVFSSNEIEKR